MTPAGTSCLQQAWDSGRTCALAHPPATPGTGRRSGPGRGGKSPLAEGRQGTRGQGSASPSAVYTGDPRELRERDTPRGAGGHPRGRRDPEEKLPLPSAVLGRWRLCTMWSSGPWLLEPLLHPIRPHVVIWVLCGHSGPELLAALPTWSLEVLVGSSAIFNTWLPACPAHCLLGRQKGEAVGPGRGGHRRGPVTQHQGR